MITKQQMTTAWEQGSGKIIMISFLVGIVAAFGAMFFELAVDLSKYLFLGKLAHFTTSNPDGHVPILDHDIINQSVSYWIIIVPTLGGLISGLLIWKFAPEAKGHGTDSVIEAYHFKRGIIRPIVPVIKTIASAITIGTGGSAGKEGPIAQIAAGAASVLGQKLKLSPKQIRIITIAGLAAGIGAIFRAPLAAGIFAVEVLYREMEFDRDVLMPLPDIINYCLWCLYQFSWVKGCCFLLQVSLFMVLLNFYLIPFVAIVVTIAARLFIWFFYRTEDVFESLTLPMWIKPAIGGLCIGIIGYYIPQTMSESYGILQDALKGNLGIGLLLLIGFGKILTTSLTIGSGGSGGVFGPSIVIGGLFGGVVYFLFSGIIQAHPAAFVIVGMAGFFSAAANTPISTIIMVSEMTGSYSLLVPTMWVASLSYILGRGATLYKKQLDNHFDAPEQMGEMMSEILDRDAGW